MTKRITLFFLFISCWMYSQQSDSIPIFNNFTTVEILLGKTLSTNSGFPEVGLQKNLLLNFGKNNLNNPNEWAYRLRYPKTGMSFVLTDYGNTEYLGYSFSVMSFIEYGLLKRRLKGLSMQMGIGATYFTFNYKNLPFSLNNAPENNSRAISTKITWAFRMFFYYTVFKEQNANWNIGSGVFHHSNGHTNLPNLGLNSVLFSVSRQSNYNYKRPTIENESFVKKEFVKNNQYYYEIRLGLGINTLSESINTRNSVYSTAISFGKTFNKTVKFGGGFYYIFYKNYYDYIVDEGELVVDEYPYFMENPTLYASNYGVNISFELLLGHVGVEMNIGYNIYKPFYKVDWRLNGIYWEGEDENGTFITLFYKELDSYFKVKKAISARIGIKYYLFNNEIAPKNNFYIGAFLNTNLAQANFTELSFGYVRSFNFKTKK